MKLTNSPRISQARFALAGRSVAADMISTWTTVVAAKPNRIMRRRATRSMNTNRHSAVAITAMALELDANYLGVC